MLWGMLALVLTTALDLPRRAVPHLYQVVYGTADGLYQTQPFTDELLHLAPDLYNVFSTPAVTRNGSQIAFVGTYACSPAIFFLEANEPASLVPLTPIPQRCVTDMSPSRYGSLRWSPDGSSLIYVFAPAYSIYEVALYAEGGAALIPPRQLHRLNLETQQVEVLLSGAEHEATSPVWSPDGEWIAYVEQQSRDPDSGGILMRMRADGSEAQVIQAGIGDYGNLTWSPDGRWIYFYAGDDGTPNIYRVTPDGNELQTLTDEPGFNGEMALSPDGKWLVFVSERDGDRELYKMRADGTQVTQLTQNGVEDMRPQWSPDGRWLVYVSYQFRERGVYIMQADGTGIRRLSTKASPDWFPNWIEFPEKPWKTRGLWSAAAGLVVVGWFVARRVHRF